MKSTFKYTFLITCLFLFVSSCGNKEEDCSINSCPLGEECIDGDCVYITPLCEACGTYSGLADGIISISLGLGTPFSNLPILIVNTESNIAYDYTLAIDISNLLGAAFGTLVPEVKTTLVNQELRIDNEDYTYQGIAVISLDGTINFNADFEEMNGSINLSGDAQGDIGFTAQRQ